MSEMNIGIVLIVVGGIIFVVAAGPIIFSVLGVVSAVVMINYGLQKMGQPPLFVLLQNFLDNISSR